VEVVASLSQGRTAAAQCGLFKHKSVPVIFEPPCRYLIMGDEHSWDGKLWGTLVAVHSTRNITENSNTESTK